ncbi:MAG: hypothetical protein J6R01_08150 [Alistipes sp.]|nr:hypothetical protein [Alistipes sp.]
MAKETATLTLRHGNKADFTPERLATAEMAAVTDERELYIAFERGSAERVGLMTDVERVGIDSQRLAVFSSEFSDLVSGSDGHFYPIPTDRQHKMQSWRATYDVNGEESTEIKAGKVIDGSDFIKCPRYLILDFADSNARCYLYFYKIGLAGDFESVWDVVNTTTSEGMKNFLNWNSVPYDYIECPEGTYMQAQIRDGVKLYGWDGQPFGTPLSADVSVPVNDKDFESAFPASGSMGVTLPGTTQFVVCKNSVVRTVFASKDGVVTIINEDLSSSWKFLKLPKGYDFFRLRLFTSDGTTTIGDVSDMICAMTPHSRRQFSAGRASSVADACKAIERLRWSPKVDVLVNGETSRAFKAGVAYNGLPYGSEWEKAHYVGWHISPHTFVNAVNDEQSVFYTEKVTNDAPYYGLVCSAFSTMCAGWSYPQTNAGFVYDPDVSVAKSATPAIGDVYSNLSGGHCLIPYGVDMYADGEQAIVAHESVTPLSVQTTRYSNIYDGYDDLSGYNVSCGGKYYDGFGYVVSNPRSSIGVSAPYAEFADVTIVGGSARPHRGDKSVYTSEDVVLINIKDLSATTLYLRLGDGTSTAIPTDGAEQIGINGYLSGDGIYYVYTDADSAEESFEYHDVSDVAVEYALSKGRVKFLSDFWYATAYLEGDPMFDEAMICCIPHTDDYSGWKGVNSVKAAFIKGTYGAYTVPVKNVYVEGGGSDEGTSEVERNYNMLENKPKINGVTLVGDVSSDELGLTGGDGSGVSDHADLTGRDKADQHPVSAITGLEKRLLRPGINLLHNADWAYSLVNQRGHSGVVSEAYCIDRWIGNGTVTPVAGQYVTLAGGTTVTQRMEIIPESLVGRECTFSIDVDGDVESVIISFPDASGGVANVATLTNCTVELGFFAGSFTLCGVSCSYVPYVKITATADINVRRVFLEFGAVSHMMETPTRKYAESLANCRRYYKKIATSTVMPYTAFVTGGAVRLGVNFGYADFRTVPTALISNDLLIAVRLGTGGYSPATGSTGVKPTSIIGTYNQNEITCVYFEFASELSANNMAVTAAVLKGYIEFNAEL